MISKIEFLNIYDSFNVDATYTRVFNANYGTTETASTISLLAQEARSFTFSLIKDSFLENILLTQDEFKKYKIVITNTDTTIEFKGLLDNNQSISYNIDTEMIDIKALSIFGFIKNSGELTNLDKPLFSIEQTVILGLASGLKDRLQYNGGEQSGAIGYFWFYYPDYNFWLSKGLTLIQLDMILSDNTVQLQDYNNRTVIYRAKVTDSNGETKYYMHNNDLDTFIFTNDENAIPCNESWKPDVNNGVDWLRYNWIDLNSFEVVGTDGEKKRAKKYVFDYIFDGSTSILGEYIEFNQTYQSLYNTSVTISEFNYQFHLDYKKAGVNHYYYWVLPDISYQNGKFPIKWYDPYHGVFSPNIPLNNDTEFLFCVHNLDSSTEIDSKAQKYQQSLFIDYINNVDYTEIQIHYLVKLRGCGVHASTSGTHVSRNGFYYRKRTIRLNGYQIVYDDFSESIDINSRAIGYISMNAYYSDGRYDYITDNDGEYLISRHATEILTLPSLSDQFAELINLPTDLYNTKYSLHCNYDTTVYAFSGVYSFTDDKNNTYRIDIGYTHDRNPSTLSPPSEYYYRNMAIISIKYYGSVNLNSYIYTSPFSIYEAMKLAMVSNLFSLVESSNDNKLQVVNKVPILNSVLLSSDDILDLKQTNTIVDSFDDNLFNVLDVKFAETLNNAIKDFVYQSFRQFDIELEFEYSRIYSGVELKIGDNFDYNGLQYSVVSTSRENDYVVKIRAIKNGTSILQFSNNGSILFDAQLSNNGSTTTNWNIRNI